MIYRLNSIPTNFPEHYFVDIDKLILKLICKSIRPSINNTIMKTKVKKKVKRLTHSNCKTYCNQDDVVLEKEPTINITKQHPDVDSHRLGRGGK